MVFIRTLSEQTVFFQLHIATCTATDETFTRRRGDGKLFTLLYLPVSSALFLAAVSMLSWDIRCSQACHLFFWLKLTLLPLQVLQYLQGLPSPANQHHRNVTLPSTLVLNLLFWGGNGQQLHWSLCPPQRGAFRATARQRSPTIGQNTTGQRRAAEPFTCKAPSARNRHLYSALAY